MATLFTQASAVPGFFGRLARRYYEARLEKAMGVVKHHRQFLSPNS
jgi:hypothetical protein